MSKTLLKPQVFERAGKVFLVTPLAPFTPGDTEIEEYAFSDALRRHAPNPNIMWLRGQFVESERANANGHFWEEGDLGIASVTPTFMPVTVMHDPTTAVGLIADTKLLTPEKDGVPRSRIDNTLGLWKHRFPAICDEAAANYESGELMQSMECLPTHYDCATCGTTYPRLPGRAEEKNWCAHLKGTDGEKAARILRNTCFTGTGLIFGSRGARGAYDEAHLEVFQDEVAEAHAKSHQDRKHKPKPRSHRTMEIEDREYQELLARKAKADELESKVTDLQAEADKVPELSRKVETLEAEKKTADDKVVELQAKVDEGEETARVASLRTDRMGKLGKDFVAKLGDFTRGRLEEQAGTLKDDEWENRLKELEDLTEVARDTGGEGGSTSGSGGGSGDGTFSREETARAGGGSGGGGGNGGNGGEVSPERRRSVVAGLARGPAQTTTT